MGEEQSVGRRRSPDDSWMSLTLCVESVVHVNKGSRFGISGAAVRSLRPSGRLQVERKVVVASKS